MNALRLFTRPQQKSKRSERSVEAVRYKASWIFIVIMTCATKARRLRGMAAMDVGIFQRRLLPRERILWSDVPAQGLLLTGRDMLLIPFSLVWCGFAIFWTYSATRQGAPLFFKAWGGMFICIGLFLVLGIEEPSKVFDLITKAGNALRSDRRSSSDS